MKKFGTLGTGGKSGKPTVFGTNQSGMAAKSNSMISGKSGYGATSVKGMRHNCGNNTMMGK